MEEREIPIEDHVILHTNVTRYVAHLPEEIQDAASVEEQLKKLKGGVPPELGRWLVKVKRDLDTPHTDVVTLAKADALSVELKELVGCYPGKTYVVGGLAHTEGGQNLARFGGNSDLDIVGAGLLSDETVRAMEAKGWEVDSYQPGYARGVRSANGLSALFYTEEKAEEALEWFGSHLRAGPDGIDLEERLRESLRNQGVELDPPN